MDRFAAFLRCSRIGRLVLTRRIGESILIDNRILVTVERFSHGGIRIAIRAPRNIPVLRTECIEREVRAEIAAGRLDHDCMARIVTASIAAAEIREAC